MNDDVDYITDEKRKALEAELEDLQSAKRLEVIAALKYAKSLGDLSENAEYHQAREEQGKLEERIAKIEQILKSSHIVQRRGGGVIEVGSIVGVQKEGSKEEKIYSIVGSEESDMASGRVSNRSPFGKALLGKKKGDNVTFTAPNGVSNYKITSVS